MTYLIDFVVKSSHQLIEMVDLGLPSGTLWAKTNVGAQSETDYGDYYQWAATTPLHVEGETVDPAADWSLCPYTDNEGNPSKYTGSDYNTLQTSDDIVASQFTGYRMPTKEDFDELLAGTNRQWTSINGINGWKFMKTNDHDVYIFLPAAGYCYDSILDNVGDEGFYWSSSLYAVDPYSAWNFHFDDEGVYINNNNRYNGFNVRPVLLN